MNTERNEISRHRPGRCDGPHATTACIVKGHVRRCFECEQEWPCHDALVHDALTAQVARLREALEALMPEVAYCHNSDICGHDVCVKVDAARAAIAQTQTPAPSGHGAAEAES